MKGEINFARLSAVLIAGLLSGSAADAQIANNRIRVGVLERSCGNLRTECRQRVGRGGAYRRRRVRRQDQRRDDRDHSRRSPEQAGRGGLGGEPLVRRRRRRHGHRSGQFRRRLCRGRRGEGQEQDRDPDQRGIGGFHRQGLRAGPLDPLDLRHLPDGQVDGRGRAGARQDLVLHHRRLRLRPCAGRRVDEFHQAVWRHAWSAR